MPNIEGIIAKLREDCCQANRNGDELCLYPITYGDARQIIAEIDRLTAERDAAVSKAEALELSNEVLEHDLIDAAITPCTYCKHDPSNGGNCDCINEHHDMFSCWEWRGAEGEGGHAKC